MLGKKMKMVSMKTLAKKVKGMGGGERKELLQHKHSLLEEYDDAAAAAATTPTGFFAVYVGEEQERFVVPTEFLSHPLFKMLLEKSYKEFGFEQKDKLVLPCSVPTFQEIVSAVECSHKNFDIGKLVEELI